MNAKDAKKIVKSAHKDAYKSTVIDIQTGENETVSVKVDYTLAPALETLAISEIADMMFIPIHNEDDSSDREVYNEEMAKSAIAVKYFTDIASDDEAELTMIEMREIDVAYGISDKINAATKGYLDKLAKDARVLSRERRVKPIRDTGLSAISTLGVAIMDIMDAIGDIAGKSGEESAPESLSDSENK